MTMLTLNKSCRRLLLGILASPLLFAGLNSQAQSTITNGLVAYWNFDGKNFKDSLGKFDGTENGSSPIAFVDAKAGFGQAIKLDGPSDSGWADQFVEITGGEPDDLAFEGGSMSVSLWFTWEAWDKQWQAVAAKGEGGNWRIHRRGAENVMAFTGGSAGDTPSGTKEINDGQWHHLVAVKDADTDTEFLWIDGVVDAMRENEGTLSANGRRMMIGENPDARNRYWHGLVDDVAVWGRPLTEAEVTALYANGTGKPLSAFFTPPVDTDKDGMPDAWEIQYGLNPNDPSDAAKDCNNNGVSNLDEFKAGLDPCDAVPPTLLSATTTSTFDTVRLTFSEDLDPVTATNVANYAFSPALAVTAATYKGKVVTLTTAKQTPGATAYTVTVTGVQDISKNKVATGTTATFYSYLLTKTGVLKFSYWGAITGGGTLDGLTTDPRYPATPDLVTSVASFNSRDAFPDDSHDNYGATITGFVTPDTSGDYVFFMTSDDNGGLWLSTDSTPANKKQIAAETGWSNARQWTTSGGNSDLPSKRSDQFPSTEWPSGAKISLVAGTKYYIELLYSEGTGGDLGQVAWKSTTDTTPEALLNPIPGKFLSSDVDLPYPAEGIFLTQTPAPNAKNVKPTTGVTIVHTDGKTPWTAANVSLKFDGAPVAPTFTKDGNVATIVYTPPALLPSKSTHTISLGYSDAGGKPATLDWSFETYLYTGTTKDTVKGYSGYIVGNAQFTPDAGGHTGKPGDRAIDSTAKGGGWVDVIDASFLNQATKNDTLSVSLWIKKYDIAAGSAFWINGSDQDRAFQAHTPWSDDTIYFDTAGCCDTTTQRIMAPINTFPSYVDDDTFWKVWHHFVFTKKADQKNIYIDGQLFLSGSSSNPLSTNITEMGLLVDGTPGPDFMHGLIDDFAAYSTEISAADAAKLATNSAPSTVTGLIAYWPFDDAGPVVPPGANFTDIRIQGANVVIQWSPGTATLQSTSSLTAPTWADVAGATGGSFTTPILSGPKYYRFKP